MTALERVRLLRLVDVWNAEAMRAQAAGDAKTAQALHRAARDLDAEIEQ